MSAVPLRTCRAIAGETLSQPSIPLKVLPAGTSSESEVTKRTISSLFG